MAASDNDAFMEDFGDTVVEDGDSWQAKAGRSAGESLDATLQAPNANDFSNARLIEEVRCNSFHREKQLSDICYGSTHSTCRMDTHEDCACQRDTPTVAVYSSRTGILV